MKRPHIVIDARLYGPRHTGLGRYTKNLLVALYHQPDFKKYRFTLLVYPEHLAEISLDLKNNYDYVPTSLKHYSILEQIFLPILLSKLKPDLVHFSHLDKPILYFGRSIVTIHDLIRHFSKGMDTTTKNKPFYWFKYLGYLMMTRIVLWTSAIIVPSNYWRDYIISRYQLLPSKIITTYEAVDPLIKAPSRYRPIAPSNYLIYTGNLYPHKNIIVLLKALQKLPDLKLKIICARDIFQQRVIDLAHQLKIDHQVEFLGYITDANFTKIYRHAIALVHPAIYEGFSLTGLEAMRLGCPVIAANSSCLPEIYQQAVLYFNPHDQVELITQISRLINNPTLRQDLITRGYRQSNKYSWTKTAHQTLKHYDFTIQNA